MKVFVQHYILQMKVLCGKVSLNSKETKLILKREIIVRTRKEGK